MSKIFKIKIIGQLLRQNANRTVQILQQRKRLKKLTKLSITTVRKEHQIKQNKVKQNDSRYQLSSYAAHVK